MIRWVLTALVMTAAGLLALLAGAGLFLAMLLLR